MEPRVKGLPAFRRLTDVKTTEKPPLYVSELGGDFDGSMKLLRDNDLRALTYREALSHAPELIEKLQGKWFYLDGEGAHENGFYTYNADGELMKPIGNEKSDQMVRVFPGQLSLLYVYYETTVNWRFDLRDSLPSGPVAPVVVGVKIDAENTGVSFKGVTPGEERELSRMLEGLPESTNKTLFGVWRDEVRTVLEERGRNPDWSPRTFDLGVYTRSRRGRMES
jgi:hypothetical protein